MFILKSYFKKENIKDIDKAIKEIEDKMVTRKEAKKRGISTKGKDFQKFLIAEAKELSETQSHKKK